MKKVHNLIFATHGEYGKKFLFGLPVNVTIKEGERIFVDTMYGESQAIAATDSFQVDSEALSAIVAGCGAYLPLKSVTGIAEPVTTYRKKPIPSNDDLPF